jgi:AcrR family transcriptional regulator
LWFGTVAERRSDNKSTLVCYLRAWTMSAEPGTFQRARRPEQREVRREAILDTAQAMLVDDPTSEISLREISRRVGLATSNVLRYFESREAIFLELLAREWTGWLDALEHELDELKPSSGVDACGRVAGVWAATLAERPTLCELWSVMSGVLERNVSVETVRQFKLGAIVRNQRLADVIARHVDGVRPDAAVEVASMASTFIAGAWPLANPGPNVIAATEDPDLVAAHVDFQTRMARMLFLLLSAEVLTDPAAAQRGA